MPKSPFDHLTESVRTKDQHNVVHDVDPRQQDQKYQPEPDEHIDLLVDYIYWQHAKCIMGLDGSRWTMFLEDALCHPWNMDRFKWT